MYVPFSYQDECLDAIDAVRVEGLTKALIVMASGLGKTVTMAFSAKRMLERGGKGRVLFLCHNNDILYQAKTTFQAVNGMDHSYGYLNGEVKNLHHVNFLFASFQTMERSRDLFDPTEFAYVIVDESHHSQADTFSSTIEYFRPQFLLGATATPDRLDTRDIRDIFGQEVFYLPLEDALAKGLLTPVDYRLLADEIVLKQTLEMDDGSRVSLAELNRTIFIPRRDEEIAKIIARHTSELESPRIMIFCTSIKHCEHLAKFIPDSFAIHSRVPANERAVKLEMFRQGVIGTVLVVDAFNEGIDIPQANAVVFLRSTVSRTVFLQQLGRGLRTSEGKDKVIVLDFVANCERIKMVHNLWRTVDDMAAGYEKEKGHEKEAPSPMTLNVNSVEFQETIIPLLKLMDRIRPTKVSEVVELAREYSQANPEPAHVVVAGTGRRLWWKCCKCHHEWQATGAARLNGTGCPACAGRVVTEKNNLLVTNPELAKEYSSKNPIPADKILATTNKKVLWVCSSCQHEWEATGSNRNHGYGCPACSGRVATPTNNFALAHPVLAKEWSPRNPVSPDTVTPASNRKYWWICSTCSHEWEASPGHRTSRKGTGCPACSKKVITAENSLAATHPDLAKEWSPRNPLPASEVFAGSDIKYWWLCSKCGHEWQARSDHRTKGNCKCPACRIADREERKKRSYLPTAV